VQEWVQELVQEWAHRHNKYPHMRQNWNTRFHQEEPSCPPDIDPNLCV